MKKAPSISLHFLALILMLVTAIGIVPVLYRRVAAERKQLIRSEQDRLAMHVAQVCAEEPVHVDRIFQMVNGFWASVRDMRLRWEWELRSGRIDTAQAVAGVSGDHASFMVVDSSGRVVLASRDNEALEGRFLTDAAVSGTRAAGVKSSLTGVRSSPVHHRPAIVVARSACDGVGKETSETVLVYLHQEWFENMRNAVALPDNARLVVWDVQLNPLIWSESVNGVHYASYIDAVARAISENPGESNVVTARLYEDDHDSILAFGRIRDLSGNAIAYMSVSAALAPVLQAANKRAVAEIVETALPLAVVSAALWIAGASLIINPLSALAKVSGRLGSGDLSARHEGSRFVGEIARLGDAFNDMADSLQARTRELEQSRFRDRHAGVYNARYLDSLAAELDGEGAGACAVIAANIDGLRMVNRAHGYDMGNAIMAGVAGILVDAAGSGGVVVRLGGDSFACILPGMQEAECAVLLKSIHEQVAAMSLELVETTLSVGVASRSNGSRPITRLINDAESSMHKNKFLHLRSPRGNLFHFLRNALGEKTHETQAHSERLCEMILELGKAMNMSLSDLNDLALLCMLHDVGKIGIPDSILIKSGPLTPGEWEVMRTHSEIGARIVMDNADLASVAEAVLSHHERWDGTGYPRGLAGEDIPLAARMLSIVDAFDAMTGERPYKKAMSPEEALQEIRRCAGSQFDPSLVEVFLNLAQQVFPLTSAHADCPSGQEDRCRNGRASPTCCSG